MEWIGGTENEMEWWKSTS